MSPEDEIRALRASGNLAAATTRTIEAYGAEVFGFLLGILQREVDAEDVFAQTSQDLWVGMPSFRGEASMRTWIYTLARHAVARHLRSPHRRVGANVPVSEVSDLVERIRTETSPYLRSDVRDRFAAIRDSLDADDQWLLVLRVARDMSWLDIARVLGTDPAEVSEADLAREAARLRKRYQKVKEVIRDRARAAGLFPED